MLGHELVKLTAIGRAVRDVVDVGEALREERHQSDGIGISKHEHAIPGLWAYGVKRLTMLGADIGFGGEIRIARALLDVSSR